MIWMSHLSGINQPGRIVSVCKASSFEVDPPSFSGIFGEAGVDYQDWVECHGRHLLE